MIPHEVFQFIPADEFDIEDDIQSCDDVEEYCLDPWIGIIKEMQGKLFQRCTQFLYCSVLSLGGNVNTRRIVTACHGIHLSHKISMKYSGR